MLLLPEFLDVKVRNDKDHEQKENKASHMNPAFGPDTHDAALEQSLKEQ